MPLVNGEQVIRSLRYEPMFRKTIIIALSTSMPEDLAQSLKTAGADFAIKKPVSTKEFSVMLESIFSPQYWFTLKGRTIAVLHQQMSNTSLKSR